MNVYWFTALLIAVPAGFVLSAILGRYAGGDHSIFPESNFIKWVDMLFVGAFHYFLFRVCTGNMFVWLDIPLALSMGLVYTLGEAPGVGQPKGQIVVLKMRGYIHMFSKFSVNGKHGGLERWQWSGLRFSPYLSLMIRGIIWAAPFMVPVFAKQLPKGWKEWGFMALAIFCCGSLWLYHPALLLFIPIWAVAMPLSMFFGGKLPTAYPGSMKSAWDWSEALQPSFVGLVVVLLWAA